MGKIIDGGILIAVFTAILFSLGIAEYGGFLSEVGVDSDFISLNAYQLLYHALFICILPILKSLMPIFTVIAVPVALCIGYDIFQPDLSGIKKWLAKKIKPATNITAEKITEKVYISSLGILLMALLFIGFVRGLIYAEQQGKQKGTELVQTIKDHRYQPHEIIKLNTPKYTGEVYVVICGSDNCAGVDVKTMEIVYFENRLEVGSVVGVVKK